MPGLLRETRVLHITTVPMTLGFVRGFIAYLTAQGIKVGVLSSPGEDLARIADSLGIDAYPVEMPRRITPLRDLQAVIALRSALRRFKPAIVHAHTPKGGLLGMIAAWLARTPVRIYHIHGLPFMTARGRKRLLLKMTERISCQLAHQVLCVSPSIRDVAIQERLCPPHKVKVMLRGTIGGIDGMGTFNPSLVSSNAEDELRQQFRIPSDAVVLGFVGRIVRDKGVIELHGAWLRLKDEFPSLHLLLVGPFEDQDPLPQEIEQQLRADERVHLPGFVTHGMATVYALMTICVLPTYREGFGNVLIEAAAMGLAVVATRVPGCVDAVIDGVTGTLVPAYDVDALADAVRTYLTDSERRRQHGQAGRDRVLRDFQPQDIWEAMYAEYSRLLGEHYAAHDGW